MTPETILYRAQSLGGRLTVRAASKAVRRQEVLLTAEEVMIEVAHAVMSAGYSLLGFTHDEFVLEVPSSTCHEQTLHELGNVVVKASAQGLGDHGRACACGRRRYVVMQD